MESSSSGRGVQPGFGNMQVLGPSLEIAIARQELNAARIDAGIERVRGKRVAQHVR
jgi:hypothetical protein